MQKLISGKLLFFYFLFIYTTLAYFFTQLLNIYHNDAISRTALAFFTIFGRDPHLAAIGFVWQPLPSFLQIPFLLILKPFGLMLLAGPLMTAIAGAFSVTIIYKIGGLIFNNRYKFYSLLIAVLFGLNPMIILYSSVGTSEMIFMCFLLLSSYCLVRYYFTRHQGILLLAGLAVSLSFWSRYEALPAFAGSCLVLIVYSIFLKASLKKMESILLQYALPFIYSVLLWILVNWLIMNDPFYFMDSPYSNASFTTAFKSNPSLLNNSYHSVINSLKYVVNRVLILAPVIWTIPLIGIPFTKKIKGRLDHLMLLLFLIYPYGVIILFHTYQLFKGESFGWLRFFIYAIPLGALLSLYLMRKHLSLAILAILLMTFGIFTTWQAINDPQLGREEKSFATAIIDPNAKLDFSRTYLDQKEIAAEMDALPGTVLIDTDKGFAVPIFSNNPNRYIITSDIDYEKIVKEYPKHADWIIIPQPAADDRGQNKIYEYYPGIWDGNAPSISLYKQVESWRIYKVERSQRDIN